MPSMRTWICHRNSRRTSSSMRSGEPNKGLGRGGNHRSQGSSAYRDGAKSGFGLLSDSRLELKIFFFRQFDSQIAKLTRIHFCGRVAHQVQAAIVFGKRHYVANALFVTDQHDEAIEAERDSAVWRRAKPKRTQQMTKLRLSIFRTDAERFEHFVLQLRFVTSHAP